MSAWDWVFFCTLAVAIVALSWLCFGGDPEY